MQDLAVTPPLFKETVFDDPSIRDLSKVGVIDIGSNSVRLVVFDGAARSPAYFFNEKIIFTGDTLFSLGCGKIFEGSYEQMFNSLMKIKALPLKTKIYCGHEYTKQNAKFCITHDKNNENLKNKIKIIDKKLENNLPTIPSTIREELDCNIFLRSNKVETFSKLRDLKDNF